MTFLIACGLIFEALVLAAIVLEAWARHRGWRGFE